MRSLRRRAVLGAAGWAAAAVAIGLIALLLFFQTVSAERFDSELADQHRAVLIALANSAGDAELMESYLPDPDFARTYSGRYWQVQRDGGTVLTSPSLFDSDLPGLANPDETRRFWEGAGPEGRVRGIAQRVTLDDASSWTVVTASSLGFLAEERRVTRSRLISAFALVGLLSIVGGLLQTRATLRPLTEMRADVARRWEAGETLEPGAYPEEIAPLVSDINLLLERNRRVIDAARRQAADLAHALKTPAAILRNELERQAEAGLETAPAREALDRIDAQILRSLARIRAGNAAAAGYRTDLGASAERLARLFRRSPAAATVELSVDLPDEMTVAMDRQDIEEVLGNLIENAMKWAHAAVRVSAERGAGEVTLHVDDDGPGIPADRRAEALRPGGRLDTATAGTGLGLAIASDLVTAYDGRIALGRAPELGGLRVSATVPELSRIMAPQGAGPA